MSSSDLEESGTKAWLPFGIPPKLGGFELQDLLGKGGMGMVFAANHPYLKRKVAIKVMTQQLQGRKQFVDRFSREIELLGRMPEHPHLVRASHADQQGDLLYVVMDYVEGMNLNSFLTKRGPLPVPEACDIIYQAALGLQAIHEAGMVHRDIKPSNLYITPDGTVKILDLGLARYCAEPFDETLTPADAQLGTYDYHSPEQGSDARTVDIRSDIYSLGCTFFKLLTGKTPYGHLPVVKRSQAHGNEPFPALPAHLPTELKHIIERMVAKNPEDRWCTPLALAQALELQAGASQLHRLMGEQTRSFSAQAHLPTPVQTPLETRERSPSILSFTWLTNSPRPWLVLTGVLCLFLALGSGIYAFVWGRATTTPLEKPQANTAPVNVVSLDELPNVDTLQELRWHSLFKGEPKPIVWHDPSGDGVLKPDPKNEKLFVSNYHAGLIGVGRTELDTFTLQVMLSQPKWQGETGVFWGYRLLKEEEKERPEDIAVFQTIILRDYTLRMLTDRDPYWALVRGTAIVHHGKNQKDIYLRPHQLAQYKLPSLRGEQTLELDFQRSSLQKVKLNGANCTELTSSEIQNRTKHLKHQGAFGALTIGSATTFREFRFKAFKPAD